MANSALVEDEIDYSAFAATRATQTPCSVSAVEGAAENLSMSSSESRRIRSRADTGMVCNICDSGILDNCCDVAESES